MDGQFAYVAALAKLTEPEEGFTASISVEVRLSQGTVTVDIDTSGTIDLGAEKKRLEKDLAAAQKELVTADNKLANEPSWRRRPTPSSTRSRHVARSPSKRSSASRDV